MTNIGCLSSLYDEYAAFLRLPEWIPYGGSFGSDCQACEDARPWGRMSRNHISTSILRAVQTLEDRMGTKLCPGEKSIVIDPEDNCPIKLDTPLWYLGKRTNIHQLDQLINWGYRDACGIPYPCVDLNPIGQLVVTDIPDEWDGDFDHVEFTYPGHYRTSQLFPRPTFDYQCCVGVRNDLHRCPEDYTCPDRCQILNPVALATPDTGYCQTFTHDTDCTLLGFTIGQRLMLWRDDNTFEWCWYSDVGQFSTDIIYDLTQFIAISVPYFVATFERYQLVSPHRDYAKIIGAKPCENVTNANEDFLSDVTVSFFQIQSGIEIIETCSCSTCKVCSCLSCDESTEGCQSETAADQTLYDYTLDSETGELCLTLNTSLCSCPDAHRVKITYGVKPEITEHVQLAIILRAFLWSNNQSRCNCSNYEETIEHWLMIEPGLQVESFGLPHHYPFGRTRAGVELYRILNEYLKAMDREGKRKIKSSGAFTGRKVKEVRPGENRRPFNPRERYN